MISPKVITLPISDFLRSANSSYILLSQERDPAEFTVCDPFFVYQVSSYARSDTAGFHEVCEILLIYAADCEQSEMSQR